MQRTQEPLPGLLGHLNNVGTCFTQAGPSDQRCGGERPCRGSVDVSGVAGAVSATRSPPESRLCGSGAPMVGAADREAGPAAAAC